MNRILETEVMASSGEAAAYDDTVKRYPYWMCRRFAGKVAKIARGVVLDVGTGPAWIPITLAKMRPGLEIFALDRSPGMLKLAAANVMENAVGGRVRLVKADARALPFEDGTFDTVISSQFLHHLDDPAPVLGEILRVAKPDAQILIEDVARPPELLTRLCVGVLGRSYDAMMKKEYADSLRAAFTKGEMAAALRSLGVESARVSFAFPHFLTVRMGGAARMNGRLENMKKSENFRKISLFPANSIAEG